MVGWAWNISDVIYLERNWEKDRQIIAKGVDQLSGYPSPSWLLLFAEGTRKTQDKFLASQEYARKAGIEPFKHLLVPRTKGFVETMKSADPNRLPAVYDVTVAVSEGNAPATLKSVLTGKKTVAEMYLKRYSTADLPKDEAGLSEFLMERYREKDELLDNYARTGSFTDGGRDSRFKDYKGTVLPPRWGSLLWLVAVNVAVGWPLGNLLWSIFTSGSYVQIGLAVFALLGLYIGLKQMISVTRVSKGSEYGSAAKKQD